MPPAEVPPLEPREEVADAPPAWPPSGVATRDVLRTREEGAADGAIILQQLRGFFRDVRFDPRGELIVATTSEKEVVVLDAATLTLRAQRRLLVRRDSWVMLGDFDETGTRIALLLFGAGEPAHFLVWDLRTDELLDRRYADHEPRPDGGFLGEVPIAHRAVGVAVHREGDWSEATLHQTPLQWGPTLAGDRIVRHVADRNDTRVDVLTLDGDVVATYPGAKLEGVLPGREALLLLDRETQTLRAQVVGGAAREIATYEGGRVTSVLVQDGQVLVSTREGREWTTHVYDAVTLEERPAQAGVRLGRWIHGAHVYEAGHGGLARTPLAGGEAQELVPDWPEDVDPPIDDQSGDYIGFMGVALAPDGESLVAVRGSEVFVLRASDGEVLRQTDLSGGAGEASIWGVVPTDDGLYTWGRSGVERWDAGGVTHVACGGLGVPVEVGDERGWITQLAACIGDTRHPAPEPETEEGGYAPPYPILGMLDGKILVATERFELRDPRTFRVRARARMPRGYEIECYDGEDCAIRYWPLGRGGILRNYNHEHVLLIDRRGRTRTVGEEGADLREVAGELVLLRQNEEYVVIDARGRTVLTLPETSDGVVLDRRGAAVAAVDGETVRVLDLEGRELMSVEDPAAGRTVLDGDALVVEGRNRVRAWHVPSGSKRLELPSSALVAASPGGSHVAACRDGRLEVIEMTTGDGQPLGDCPYANEIAFVDGGRMVVVVQRVQATVVRPSDGARLTLRTARRPSLSFATNGDSVWVEPGGSREHLRWRAPGPLRTAAVGPVEEVDEDLLSRFFAPPAETPE